MRTRVQVSTDVAALGIWDRGQPALIGSDLPTLEQLAQKGEACILRMGADCGGAVDVFVDEDFHAELLAESIPVAQDRTVVVRSGGVVIDGMEYFAAAKKGSSETSSIGLPNGIYRTKFLLTKNDDELSEPHSEKELKRMIGATEVDYYDKTNREGLLFGLGTLLVLPVLLFFIPWFVAVPATLGLFLGYFHFRQWLLRRNPRYQSAAERIVPWRLARERPILAIQLSKWDGELLGGPAMSAARAVAPGYPLRGSAHLTLAVSLDGYVHKA